MGNQNERKTALARTSFGIAVMFGIYWLYTYILRAHMPFSGNVRWLLGLFCLYVPGLGAFVRITRSVPSQKCEKRRMPFRTIMLCFLLQFTAIMVMSMIVGLLTALGWNGSQTQINAASPAMLFMLLVFNPIMEELVFRKLFADKLLQYGEGFYMLASAFCFAIPHGVSLGVPQIAYTFMLGMIWSYVMAKTGDLKTVVVLHALSNLCGSVAMQFLMGASTAAAGIYSMVLMVLGLVGFILFFINRKKIVIEKSALTDLIANKGIWFYVALTLAAMAGG